MRTKSHSIIYVPVKGARNVKLPVILLPDGARFYEALHWTVERFDDSLSVTTLKKQNEAIGAFVDFFHVLKNEPAVTPELLRALIKEFREVRLAGCQDLGWKPVAPGTSEREIEYLSLFFDHCADALGYLPVNAADEVAIDAMSYRDRLRENKKASIRRKGLLGYLWKKTAAGSGKSASRPVRGRQGVPRGANNYKSFPPHKVASLIESCHSIRDVMVFILLFYGGVRSSEVCHVLVSDISPFPDPKTGEAIVTLAHPVYGWIDYHRKADGKGVRHAQRQTYLLEEYGMTPRNLLSPDDPMQAGWKGMTYEDKGYRSTVHWSRPDMGILFYELHKRYMAVRAKTGTKHPYYFVNIDPSHSRGSYGQPMKLKSLRDRFHDACLRVGLTPGRDNGINPHGARHFYGFFLANVLRVSKEMAQRFLHHGSIDSTDVYYNLTAAVARDELLKAFEDASSNPDNPLTQPLKLKAK